MRSLVNEFDLDVRIQTLADTKDPPPRDQPGVTLTCPIHRTCGDTCSDTCARTCTCTVTIGPPTCPPPTA